MGVKFADKAATTITGGIAADATSVTVSSASGFPDVTGAGDFFYATLERANDATTYEVVKVTNLSSTTYTIDRSVESSSTFSAGDTFALRLNEHALVDPSLLQAGITTDTLTVDAGSGSSEATLHSSTGAAKLHINTDASGGSKYGSIELGGTDGAFIDIKEPNGDDYDFRIEHGITSPDVSLVTSKHPLILQTQGAGTGGDVKIKREGAEKLATSATGIDVTGEVKGDTLNIDGAASIAGAVTDVTTLTASGEIEGGSLDINGAADISGDLTLSAGGDGALTFANAGENSIKIPDNQASALIIEEANTAYMTFVTTNSSEKVTFGKNIEVTGTVTATGIALNGNMETDGNITIQNGHEFKLEAADGSESLSIGTNSNNATTIHEQGSGNLNIKGDALVLFGNNRDLAKITVHDEGGVKIDSEVSGNTTTSYARIKVGNQHTGTRFYCGTDETNIRAEVVSAGLNVNGTVTADGITNAGALSNTGDVTIIGTSTANAETPQLILERTVDDTAGVGFHDLGSIVAKGVDLANTSNRHTYAEIDFDAAVETAGSEAGRITFKTSASGASPTEVASARNDAFYAQNYIAIQTTGGTNRFTTLKSVHTDDSTTYTVNLPSASGTLALTSDITVTASSTTTLTNKSISGEQINSGTIAAARVATLNQDTTGHAASADIATGALVSYGSSGNVAHDTVKTFAGKTVIYTSGSGNLVIGVPEIADMSAGKQIHFVNASGGEIQFDLNESGNSSITIDICTGAAVVNTGSDNPKIVAGGVATLVSLTTNKLVMFGSGVVDT